MAKNREAHPSERLQELISERQRYEEWLAELETRRDSAPAHVLARVEQDYRGRVALIGEELSARAGELKERLRALSERLSEIKREEAARRDEKAEAELRTAVGEYSPGQWAEIAANADRDLAALEGNRQLMEREWTDLQRVLSVTTGSPPPAAAASAPADATRTAAATAPPQRSGAAPRAPAPAPAAAPARPAAPAPAAAAPRAPAAPASARGQLTEEQARRPRAGRIPSSQGQKQGTRERTEQEKTLLCNECGTANYPTEWYCEACGAELSTL